MAYEGLAIKAVKNGFTLSGYSNTDSWSPETDEFVFTKWEDVVQFVKENEVTQVVSVETEENSTDA